MRINLLYTEEEPRSGYLNVSPFATEETDELKIGDPTFKLSAWVDDAEATEIVANDVIDYLPADIVMDVLSHWVAKLRHGGTLIIGGTDLYEVCKGFTTYAIDVHQANAHLHGHAADNPQFVKKITLTALGLSNFLATMGLTIIKKRVTGYHFIVEAKRP